MEKSKSRTPFMVIGLACLCQALWGCVFPFVKVAYGMFEVNDVGSSLRFASIRFMTAGVVLFIISSIKERRLPKLPVKELPALMGLGTIQTGMVYAFQFIGMLNMPAINCSIINGLQPAFVLLIAYFMFDDERITRRKIVGVVLGLSGVMFCFLYGYSASSISLGGEGLMFLSMLSFALGTNVSRKVTRSVSPMVAAASNLLVGGIELFILSAFFGGHLAQGGLLGWSIMVFLVFVSSVCLYLWTMLGHAVGVSRIAVFMSVNPVSGAVCSALVAGENILQLKYIVAIVLVVSGIIVINTKTSNKQA